jgi:hypothetical protein
MTHFKQLDDAVFGCFKNSPKEKLSETRLFSYATESPQSSIVNGCPQFWALPQWQDDLRPRVGGI